MTATSLRFAGVSLLADVSGALVIEDDATLVVADLHFEKASCLARAGALLPPYDSQATLGRLADVVGRYAPRRIVCLGDSFHDPNAPLRLRHEDRRALRSLVERVDWWWLLGNHDMAGAPALNSQVGGRIVEDMRIGPLTLRHQAMAGAVPGEISGHFHPKASVLSGGRRVTARCFVSDGSRLILPAFGSYAGGLDVLDPAISDLLQPQFTAYVLGRQRVHALQRDMLHPGHQSIALGTP